MEVSFDDILERYGREIAQLTQRAIVAEAGQNKAIERIAELEAEKNDDNGQ